MSSDVIQISIKVHEVLSEATDNDVRREVCRLRLGFCAATAGDGAALDALSKCGQVSMIVACEVCLTWLVMFLLFAFLHCLRRSSQVRLKFSRDVAAPKLDCALSGWTCDNAGVDSMRYKGTCLIRLLM